MSKLTCCIYGNEILPNPLSGWERGNNAQPIDEGRCCDGCDNTVVIPERIRRYRKGLSMRKVT